ncbi:hypothetical protein FS749_000601 [Ceratobasidium sp. UAMH 11750]|nr:hypothetical protein FS749_000601 [Ceratobasidium sp. UAMH 11750]
MADTILLTSGSSIPKAAEEESSNALSGVKRDLAPMVSRLVDFLSPLVPQINSLIASILWPYQSTLTTLTDLWALCGTPDHAKVLKVRAHPDLPELKVRSLPSYKLFFESLEVLHLLNACLAWSEFSFGNLIELRIETWRGEWSMASSELASVLASCPRLQHLAPHHPQTEIASATNPKPALLADLQTLELGGLSYLSREGTTLLELILATINPGQNALRASISLRHLVGPSQRALDAIGAFVRRSNMATLRIYYPGLSEMSGYPLYFASQLGPLPRVQTLALDNWCFCDSLKVDQMFGRIKTYENPRPINPDRVLWPQLQNLYLNWCNLEAGHLNQLISLHSIQSLFIRNCYDWCDPQSPFDSGTPTSKQFVQMLSAVVPRIVHFSNARGSWLPFMNLVPPRL